MSYLLVGLVLLVVGSFIRTIARRAKRLTSPGTVSRSASIEYRLEHQRLKNQWYRQLLGMN